MLPERLAPGAFDSANDGAGLVDGLFEFFFWDRVGNDAGTGLDVSLFALLEQSADGDAGVKVSRVIGVEDTATVDAATRRF